MLQQREFIPQSDKWNPLTYPRNGLLMCKSHHSLFDAHYFFLRYRMDVISFYETAIKNTRIESITLLMPLTNHASNNSTVDPLILKRIHHMLHIQIYSSTMRLFVVGAGLRITKFISSLAQPVPRHILPHPPHRLRETPLRVLVLVNFLYPIRFPLQLGPIHPRESLTRLAHQK